jgi:hypothetical protein
VRTFTVHTTPRTTYVPSPSHVAALTLISLKPPPPPMASAATAPYSASCNPPRRAKRPRTDAEMATTSAATSSQAPAASRQRPHILPKDATGSSPRGESPSHESSDDEDEYDPVEPAPAPKRRGRKPGPLSRSARESQRKLNHSRIEKARRTKINETLATLSGLVSEAEKQRLGDKAPVQVEEKKGEKEFKLDVLVKTVVYVQELLQHVKTLESRTCSRCSSGTPVQTQPVSPPESPHLERKRKAEQIDVDVSADEAEDDADDEATAVPSPRAAAHHSKKRTMPPSRSPSKHPSQSPCLPPISSWLPNPYIDPSCLTTLPDPSGPPSHLPTPPLSGSFRVPLSVAAQAPPALALPGPAHPLLAEPPSPSFAATPAATMRIALPARRLSGAASPSVSPSWTPEDETAASLLLQMSTSPSTTAGASSMKAARVRGNSLESAAKTSPVQAETPSSLLGLGRHG